MGWEGGRETEDKEQLTNSSLSYGKRSGEAVKDQDSWGDMCGVSVDMCVGLGVGVIREKVEEIKATLDSTGYCESF